MDGLALCPSLGIPFYNLPGFVIKSRLEAQKNWRVGMRRNIPNETFGMSAQRAFRKVWGPALFKGLAAGGRSPLPTRHPLGLFPPPDDLLLVRHRVGAGILRVVHGAREVDAQVAVKAVVFDAAG